MEQDTECFEAGAASLRQLGTGPLAMFQASKVRASYGTGLWGVLHGRSLTSRPLSFKDKGHASSAPLIAAQKLDLCLVGEVTRSQYGEG